MLNLTSWLIITKFGVRVRPLETTPTLCFLCFIHVPTAARSQTTIVRDMTPCIMVEFHQHFWGTCSLSSQGPSVNLGKRLEKKNKQGSAILSSETSLCFYHTIQCDITEAVIIRIVFTFFRCVCVGWLLGPLFDTEEGSNFFRNVGDFYLITQCLISEANALYSA